MLHRLPIGISDFRVLRESGLEYIDKTQLVCDILDRPGEQVLLLPRPRRFGKTLNLSMLRCFFEKRAEDLSPLFQDLRVFAAGEEYRAHFQRYPVLHLTFKDIKHERWERAWAAIRKKITDLFNEHRYLLDEGRLDEVGARRFRLILDETAGPELYDSALFDLSRYLHRAHGERVVILIEEYDEPIHVGYVHGYASEVLEFFRAFLTGGLKDNPHLHRAVVTGLLDVVRESFNNAVVYTLLRPDYSASFGFTEAETEELLERASCLALREAIRSTCGGYIFGDSTIYNPWSVLRYLESISEPTCSYQVSTTGNELLQIVLTRHALQLEPNIATLLEGGAIEHRLFENFTLPHLSSDPAVLWSLLVFSGYLRAEKAAAAQTDVPPYRLSIPNQEVRAIFTGPFQVWMKERLERASDSFTRLRVRSTDDEVA